MPHIIARFSFLKSMSYSVLLTVFGIWFLWLPFAFQGSFFEFLISGRFTRWWPLGVPGAAGAILIGVTMLTRLALFKRSALYECNGNLILMFPFL